MMYLEVAVLEESFDLIAPRGDELIEIFYQRVFELAPEARALFARTDWERQKRALLSTLVLLRNSLRNLERLVPALAGLGERHAGYGVRPEHYAPVGQALLESMATIGGDQWKPEYTRAWTIAYETVSAAMLAGAATISAS